jgi:hypothetical protein
MNIFQRIVLLVGALTLIIILRSTGTTTRYSGSDLTPDFHDWDWRSAIVRGLIISAATAAIYFAVGKRK